MRYVARTVDFDERRQNQVESYKVHIPELEVYVDHNRDLLGAFFNVCDMMSDTGGVMIQDDVVLCKDFKRRAEEIIKARGNGELVINFFDDIRFGGETALMPGKEFNFMQCSYFPASLLKKCRSEYEVFKNRGHVKWIKAGSDDYFISWLLHKEKLSYWRIRPALVQHLDYPSLMGKRSKHRQTPYFIDDMENGEAKV